MTQKKSPASPEQKPRFQTIFNRHLFPHTGEVNNMPSRTIPDQTLSMQEILTRYARGLPLTNGKQPIYNGDEDLPDLKTMDLAEIQEYKENIQSQIKEYTNAYNAHKMQQEKNQSNKIAELEKKLKQLSLNSSTTADEKTTDLP